VNPDSQTTPDFLAIGHAARDLVHGGRQWGGTVTYAALLAHAWGVSTAVLTALAAADVPNYRRLLGGEVHLQAVPSPATTTMENIYSETGREQRLHARAAQIKPHHVPTAWREAPIVLVGPILHDVSTKFSGFFPKESFVGLTIQGRLRSHRSGRVYRQLWHRAEREFPAYDVLFFSIEDVRYSIALAEAYAELAPLAVMTRGNDGATLFHNGKFHEIAAYPAQAVDLTGAGDVFAAAFMLSYVVSRDPVTACYYANAAAACSVEHTGASGMPSREEVSARLHTNPI
jgi:sugar/nucleoside kinase (ribokinase family)